MAIEVLQGLERKALISVNKKQVDELVKQELKKYAKKAKAQGFRPGKVPANVVEQMYGKEAFEEVLNKKVNDNFLSILLESKLLPAGYPKFDLTSSEGEEFIFTALFEVMPTIKIGDLSKESVIKPICTISEDKITATIESLRKQRATYIPAASDRLASDTDKVVVDFVGTVDGVEFEGGRAESYPFILGQKQMLLEFENGVQGLMASESKEIEVNFPENYHAENLRGKKAIFNLTLRSIEVQQLPELNLEFIQSIGVSDGSIEALRKEIGLNLESEITRRVFAKTRENVLNALYASTPLDVPSVTVHDEIHRMMDSTKEKMKQQGYKEEQIKLTHDMFAHDAKKLVVLRLLVQEIIKEQNITVTDDEVKSTVEGLAQMYDDAAKYVEWYYQNKERVATAQAQTMEKKVIDYILSMVQVTESEMEFDELLKETV